jgi:DNA-binding IclR family transcriptional regulator
MGLIVRGTPSNRVCKMKSKKLRRPDEAGSNSPKSIEHAIAMLMAFADATRPLSVTEIADSLGLHKSTVSRQLATLSRVDFVKRENGSPRYTLGLGLLPLAAAALASHQIGASARSQLEMLAAETQETVTYSGWNGHDAVNLDQIRGPGAIQHIAPAGRLNPAHCTATGKVFLASLSEDALSARLSKELKPYTAQTIVDAAVLRKHLEKVRSNGYAVSNNEFLNDVCSVAARIPAKDGLVQYAVAVTLPSYRASPQKLDLIIAQLLFTVKELCTLV